ncbi:hypothetical protein FACS1894190_05680 [Spirochaetia bacterium]|nr:hypothetical protein FACS1894190_05680 [Spirochaetia bacterium]
MSFFNENLSVLKKRFPALAQKIQLSKLEKTDAPEVKESKSGFPSLVSDGVLIHSLYDPVREGRRLAETALTGLNTISVIKNEIGVIVLGFGLGYAAEEAARLDTDCIFIVVENRIEIFMAALDCRNLTNFLENTKLVFIIGGDAAGINAALPLVKKIKTVMRNPALMCLDASWYNDIETRIKTWQTKDEVNNATLRRFGKRWVRNTAENLNALCDLPGVNFLVNRFDFPIFMAAAGPSLDDIGHYLPEIAERAIIVAVDTSLNFFRRVNIKPDFIITTDGQYWNARHFDFFNLDGCALIADIAVQPCVIRNAKKGFLFSALYPLGQYFEQKTSAKGELGAGGSVATTALDFACLLNKSSKASVWIAGLDLAFPDNKTHYNGAVFEQKAIRQATRFIPAQTASFNALLSAFPFTAAAADGGTVRTDKRLSLYAAWFTNRAASEKLTPIKRLTSKGIAIDGLINNSIDGLMALPACRNKIDEQKNKIFGQIENEFNKPEEILLRTKKFEAVHNNLVVELESIIKKSLSIQNLIQILRSKKITEQNFIQEINNIFNLIEKCPAKNIAAFIFPDIKDFEFNEFNKGMGGHNELELYVNSCESLLNELIEGAKFNLQFFQ